MGADSVRFRVFVNPPKDAHWQKKDGSICKLGYCDKDHVVKDAVRAKDAGMRVMIDFHYSDHFADPQYQDIPEAWVDSDDLPSLVKEHTMDVLLELKANGVTPEWVQVGNEINPGMLLPKGSMKDEPETLVACLNAGYEGVKEVFPDTRVITHLAGISVSKWCEYFLDRFFEYGGKTDILGFSHYPYWFDYGIEAEIPALYLTKYAERYQKPVMICEVGGTATKPDESYDLLVNSIRAVKMVPYDKGLGIFYWEPEAAGDGLPDQYPLGAAVTVAQNTFSYTRALTAYRDSKDMKAYDEREHFNDEMDV